MHRRNLAAGFCIICIAAAMAVFIAESAFAADCLDCHSRVIGTRADIALQLKGNSHHVQGVVANGRHCYACHWEANPDGTINSRYHQGFDPASGESVANAKVDLVVWGNRGRPERYRIYSTAVTFNSSAIGTTTERREVVGMTLHCLGCHEDRNNQTPVFEGDVRVPGQYAWDSKSIASRYANRGTALWSSYSTLTGNGKRKIVKAYSAHGNATSNRGGWSRTSGYEGNVAATRGGSTARNVECFDCHNSHGSISGGVTSSYRSFDGSFSGALLKQTVKGIGGYSIDYTPRANRDTGSVNPYNEGAGLCFDCHETAEATSTPWGFTSTFGALEPVMGYKDTLRFGQGVKGSSARHASRPNRTSISSSHLKAGRMLSYSSHGRINGLCTPCHDPHGISTTLDSRMQYALPLLKGTWLTSPYRDDTPPVITPGKMGAGGNMFEKTSEPPKISSYSIDRNTFASSGRIAETEDSFAGLCLACHRKESFKTGDRVERIHRVVKGWGSNREHAFPCSKCHQPHNSGLPRLMQTNCLESSPPGLRDNETAPWTEKKSSNPPAQGSIEVSQTRKSGSSQVSVGCHVRRGNRGAPPSKKTGDSAWNNVTKW